MTTLDLTILALVSWVTVSCVLTCAMVIYRAVERAIIERRRDQRHKAANAAATRYLARMRDAGLL